MAESSIGVLNPCGISFPGLKLNKLEVSASANEIGDGSDVEAEASGVMAL
jgi:hypothetical protein